MIGIVAALTIPTLITKINDTILKTQFRKAYSEVYQIYKKSLDDLEYNVACFYDTGIATNFSDCSLFYNTFKQNAKIALECNGRNNPNCFPNYKRISEVRRLNNPNISDSAVNSSVQNCGFEERNTALILSDGVIIFQANAYTKRLHYFAIDINGFKGPNKWGYDVFPVGVRYKNMADVNSLEFFNACAIWEPGGRSFENMKIHAFK